MIEKVYGYKSSFGISEEIEELFECINDMEGTLYFGYPIIVSNFEDSKILVEALFVSPKYGVVVFTQSNLSKDKAIEQQDNLYVNFESKLKSYPKLKKGRKLIPSITTITYTKDKTIQSENDYNIIHSCDELKECLENIDNIDNNKYSYQYINTVIESLANLKPQIKREIKNDSSYGGIIKQIEREIANLDSYQKKAALEISNAPQRIRGLAGSGKTIVLALKAAYLHVAYPDKKICITYNARSLKNQFIDLIRRFTFEHIKDEPNWDNLHIIHAWGSKNEIGVYSSIAAIYEQNIHTFNSAKYKYGYKNAFGGACDELLENIKNLDNKILYDIILIDEAQDLPRSFFELCLKIIPEDKHIIWAYDELQNIGQYTILPPQKLFGVNKDGYPNVESLENKPKQPRQDIVLKVCYRNHPQILTAAHAFGFGIYREKGFIQFFDEPEFWEDIGYKKVSGVLDFGKEVEIERDKEFVPKFFIDLMKDDVLEIKNFESKEDQYNELAKEIKKNIENDELRPSDILVINANPLTTKDDLLPLKRLLEQSGINAHLAGVTSSRDEFFIDGYVTLSGIYRAKGNEAVMVYIINSEYCYDGFDIVARRNILFTAMTRSKGWVRVYGVGEKMEGILQEYNKLKEKNFKLKFKYPTKEELENIRKINRDLKEEEKQFIMQIENLKEQIKQIDPEIFQKLDEETKEIFRIFFK